MTQDYDLEHNGQAWNGKERRREQRREGHDRRDMIRFEPEKDDRRTGQERRKNTKSGWDSGTSI
jgi:hypothetical protein